MKTKNGLTISLSNQKLGAFIPCVNLPAIVTCRDDAPCKRICLARKGRFNFPNVRQSHSDNLLIYKNNASGYFQDIIDFIKNGLVLYKFFRWHSSGDIVDADYFNGVVKVATECKSTSFLLFTKKFEIVNDFIENGGKIPQNLAVVFSAWDNNFEVKNPYSFPVAYVDFKDKSNNPAIPVTAFRCGGNCEKCLTCWSIQKGQATAFNQH